MDSPPLLSAAAAVAAELSPSTAAGTVGGAAAAPLADGIPRVWVYPGADSTSHTPVVAEFYAECFPELIDSTSLLRPTYEIDIWLPDSSSSAPAVALPLVVPSSPPVDRACCASRTTASRDSRSAAIPASSDCVASSTLRGGVGPLGGVLVVGRATAWLASIC